ncbi:MAG: tetratricopeptide repeat protein, partial [Caldilineaceae bacterium]|nr:tetratricopeptide repeat protein [Caldilineaceae bacterium]
ATFSYADGVYFVALQTVSATDPIVPSIISALAWTYDEGKNAKAALIDYLRDKSLLLILDNVEHLTTVAPLIQELLHAAPKIKVLVTSRVVLNLAEEWLFWIGGMSLSTGKDDDFAAADAVELFRQRAQRVHHDFSLIDEQEHVARICQLVEGTPLAIELAAAWLTHLPCAAIRAEIQKGLDILQSEQLGIPDRHRTMRAIFDYSWRLLSHNERELLEGLSAFQGGFQRAASEEVAGATLSLLSSLIDKSLLRVSATGRYTIHELQRQYGLERLADSPQQEAVLRARHSAYYLRLVSQPIRSYLGERSQSLVKEIEVEISNILAAWYWAVEHEKLTDLHAAIEGLYWFAWLSKYHEECEKALRYAIETLHDEQTSDEYRITYAHALAMHGIMSIWLGHHQRANDELVESVARLRQLPNARRELANAVGGLGWSMYADSKIEAAKTLLYEAVELDQETEQFELQAWIYCLLGNVTKQQGAYEECRQWYQQALALGRAIVDQRTIAHALCELGWQATNRGEYVEARNYLEESLFTARSHNIVLFEGRALAELGQLALARGELEAASTYFEQRLVLSRNYGKLPISVSVALIGLAQLHTAQGDYAQAANLHQQVSDLLTEAHQERSSQLLASMGKLALHTGHLAGARLTYEECLAISRQSGAHVVTAQALIGLGRAAMGLGEEAEARRHLFDALQEAINIGFAPLLLECITAAAELFSTDGDFIYAAHVAALVKNHAASTAETRACANKLLAQARPEVAVETFALAAERAHDNKLEAVASKLANKLARSHEVAAHSNRHDSLASSLIEPLSERELEVLRLVAAGKSNRQIGSELYLALGTVKAHLNHIFQKLAVQSRTEAVVRAMDLDLL